MSGGITLAMARRLLVDAPWAQARLKPYAGHYIRWNLAGLEGAVELDSEGLPVPATSTATAGVRVTLAPAGLNSLAQGFESLLRHVELAGNAGLAAELAYIARHLRPDPADWLAPWLGDVMAERAGRGLTSGSAWAFQAAGRAARAGAEFAVHEARLLPDRPALAAHVRQVEELRQSVECLARQVERLERGVTR